MSVLAQPNVVDGDGHVRPEEQRIRTRFFMCIGDPSCKDCGDLSIEV